MRFKKLILKGFQTHQYLEVELDQITVLIGDNDCGKSSVHRALLWLCLNQWDGDADSFIHWDEKVCEVTLETVEPEHVIQRIKGKGVNKYVLDGEDFNTPGVRVPDKIAGILQISLDNFQQQDEPAFWLGLSDSKAASALNEIFNLTAIDDALANAGSEVRQAKSTVSICKQRLTELEKAAKELEWVEQADADLKIIEQNHQTRTNLSTKIELTKRTVSILEAKTQAASKLDARIDDAGNILLMGVKLPELSWKVALLKNLVYKEDLLKKTEAALKIKEDELKAKLLAACPLCGRS